jgi:hypothetical protein
VIPLIVTNRVRGQIAPGASFDDANAAVLADLADGWTLLPSDNHRHPPAQEFVRLAGRDWSYVAKVPGFEIPAGWCLCPNDEPCGCRPPPADPARAAVKVTECERLSPSLRAIALRGDRYADRFGLDGVDAGGDDWRDALWERWTRVQALVRRRPSDDVLGLWEDMLHLRKRLVRSLSGPVPYGKVELDEEGRVRFQLADAGQQIPQGAIYQLPAHERVQLRVVGLDQGVLTCDSGTTHPKLVRDVADTQRDDQRRLVLDAAATDRSLKKEEMALRTLRSRQTCNPDLLDVLLDASLAREDDWIAHDETPIHATDDPGRDEAVRQAMRARDVLVVQGPPGTGKTTFVAELVLRHLREHPGDTVLIASQTHHATDNVLLRVHELDPDVPLARVAPPWQVEEKVAREARRFWLDDPNREETGARRRAERYRAFAHAQLASGAWEPATAGPLLAIQREYLGEQDARPLRQQRLDAASVVAGTCYAVGNTPDVRDRIYELAIIEEAGKASPTEALMGMLRATKVVLVGDVRQLPPTPDHALQELLRRAHRRPQEIDDPGLRAQAVKLVERIVEARRQIPLAADRPREYTSETLFAYLGRQLRREQPRLEVTLRRQYRMASGIGDLVSACFYEGNLENRYDDARRDPRAVAVTPHGAHVLLADVTGVESRPRGDRRHEKSYQNTKEATRATRLLDALEREAAKRPDVANGRRLSVAVLTGYSAQRELLRREIARQELPHLDLHVDVIDNFQGSEAEVAIVSLVRTEKPGFMDIPNRVNVALSRARSLLIVLVSLERARSGTLGGPVQDMVAYVERQLADGDKRYELRTGGR